MPATTTRYARPLGLQAQAEEAANGNNNRRMAELQALAPLLALLDPFMPGLRALGLDLEPTDLWLAHEQIGHRRWRVLRARTSGVFMSDIKRICDWMEALKALGFTEISRADGAYPTALLRRGAMLIRVDALRTPPAATAPAVHGPNLRQAIAEAQATAPSTQEVAA